MHLQESAGPSLPEEQVSSREAELESQIARQVRLLPQLKRNGAQGPEPALEPLSTAIVTFALTVGSGAGRNTRLRDGSGSWSQKRRKKGFGGRRGDAFRGARDRDDG